MLGKAIAIFSLIVGMSVALLFSQPGFAGESAAAISTRQACASARATVYAGRPTELAQGECPPEYPVDCYDGGCCPAGMSCCDDGSCCPAGYPHHCGSRCYATLQGALDAGCSVSEVSVCGVAQ